MEWRCWHKLLFSIVILSFLIESSLCQSIENFPANDLFISSDSIACDTFPPPRNLDGYTQDDAIKVWWEVPLLPMNSENSGGFFTPENLLGYKLYRNDDFLNYIEYDGEDTTTYWDFTLFYPDLYCYTVTALYDLGVCGLPGDTGISIFEGPFCAWGGYEGILPFVEDWNTGSFDPNLWTADSNWFINGQSGNPQPTAQFTESIIDTNYHSSLISYWINCKYPPGTGNIYIDGDFWLEFDIKLDDNSMSGNEFLTVQLTDSIDWQTITEFSNEGGSFDWQFNKINITDLAKGNYIRISFVAEGQNATDINSWYIDNIMLYRQCNPPLDLQWLVFDESMAWSPPLPHTSDHSDISRELLGYNVYEITQFLDFTIDTFYVLDQSYGYGPYYVTAVYEDCEPASNPIFGPTGIDENLSNTEIKIFPNPAKDRISIRSDKVISRIQLIKSDGVLILDRNFQNSFVSLPLDNYPAGIYLLKIYQDNTVINRKLLLEK